MKTKSLFRLIAFLCLCTSLSAKEKNNINAITFKAYNTNSINLWKEAVKQQKIKIKEQSESKVLLLELAEIYSGLTNSCIANRNEELYNQFYEEQEQVLKMLKNDYENDARYLSLQAHINSSRIAFYPMRAMVLGPKSSSYIEDAYKSTEQYPRTFKVHAGNLLNTPSMFGGDKNKAIELYKKALKSYENKKLTTHNWEYIDCFAWLGIAYYKTEQYEKAVEIYNKVLLIAPDFNWVKYHLLPKTKEKTNK